MKNFIYDGSFEGFLTTVFKIYELDSFNANIASKNNSNLLMLENATTVETSEKLFKRVKSGIIKKAGINIYNEIATTFCSSNQNKENIVFEYLKLVFAFSKKARLMLQNKAVINYNALLKKVTYERHRMLGFLRFTETADGVLYANYSPDNNITSLILNHFANRFSTEDFIIHDEKRNVFGVYSAQFNKFFIYENKDAFNSITPSKSEHFFQKLWQQYYNNAPIKERENLKLRNQHMPTRYHNYLTEIRKQHI